MGWLRGAGCYSYTSRMDAPGPSMGRHPVVRHCLLSSVAPTQDELIQNIQRLWQLDTVLQWEGKDVTWSK